MMSGMGQVPNTKQNFRGWFDTYEFMRSRAVGGCSVGKLGTNNNVQPHQGGLVDTKMNTNEFL